MSIRRDRFGTPIIDLPFNIALNEIPGLTWAYKFGRVVGLDTVQRTIWTAGFEYNPPPDPVDMYFASTSSEDCFLGAGANYMKVGYVGSGFVEHTEVHCICGHTPIKLNNPVHTINRTKVLSDDIDAVNAGPMWIGTSGFTNGVPSSAYAHVNSGVGQTYQAFYTVPHDKTLIVYDMIMSANEGKEGEVEIFARDNSETFSGFPNARNTFQAKNHYDIFQTTFPIARKIPLVFNPKTEILFKGRGKAAATNISVEGTFILVDSAYLNGSIGL